MRVEDPVVFQAGHRLVLELVRSGKVDGLRIDHIDGLADPLGYQKQLAREDVYTVAEKILSGRRKSFPPSGRFKEQPATTFSDR